MGCLRTGKCFKIIYPTSNLSRSGTDTKMEEATKLSKWMTFKGGETD